MFRRLCSVSESDTKSANDMSPHLGVVVLTQVINDSRYKINYPLTPSIPLYTNHAEPRNAKIKKYSSKYDMTLRSPSIE